VNRFHEILKTVKGAHLGRLNFVGKPEGQVLADDAVRGGKKRQDHFDKILFILVQFLPVADVGREVNVFYFPKAVDGLLVQGPDVVVDDGEHHVPVLVGGEKRFYRSTFDDVSIRNRLVK